MEDYVLTQRTEWGAILTLNRPEALNALNVELLHQLDEQLRILDEQPGIYAVVLTGAGEKAFAAGADIGSMRDLTPEQARQLSIYGQSVMNHLAGMHAIVIAAVNGYALGGGCELAMACDIRIASRKAKFGIPEVTLGVIPGFGGTQRLPQIVGLGRALELMATGRQITAEEALQIGLISHRTEPEELLYICQSVARKIAANSAIAVALGKQSMYTAGAACLEQGLECEAELFCRCFTYPDQREGMDAFLKKRRANFSKESPAG